MRRLVLVSLPLFVATPALAQDRVDQVPSSATQTPPSTEPRPAAAPQDAPSRREAGAAPRVLPAEPQPRVEYQPAAPLTDTLRSHFVLAATVGTVASYGRVDSAHSITNTLGQGWLAGGELGYGISRHIAIGLVGEASSFSGGSICSDCKANAWSAAPFLRYHLVQGVRFDPWMSIGAGVAALSYDNQLTKRSYFGGVLRASVGGDWYASSQLGIGPVLSVDLRSYMDHPTGTSASQEARLLVGLRVVVDVPGK